MGRRFGDLEKLGLGRVQPLPWTLRRTEYCGRRDIKLLSLALAILDVAEVRDQGLLLLLLDLSLVPTLQWMVSKILLIM